MVLRALCAEYERLDSVFCNYKQSVYTQVVCDGRREADPMFSAGQFLSARPEEDSPHWRLNACIIAAVNFGFGFLTSAWSSLNAFFFSWLLFSLFSDILII